MEEADNNSNATACSFLGEVYEEGVLLPKDFNKAIKYYQKGMNGGESYSHYRFAMALIKGQCNKNGQNKEDIIKGFKMLEQVAASAENSVII